MLCCAFPCHNERQRMQKLPAVWSLTEKIIRKKNHNLGKSELTVATKINQSSAWNDFVMNNRTKHLSATRKIDRARKTVVTMTISGPLFWAATEGSIWTRGFLKNTNEPDNAIDIRHKNRIEQSSRQYDDDEDPRSSRSKSCENDKDGDGQDLISRHPPPEYLT